MIVVICVTDYALVQYAHTHLGVGMSTGLKVTGFSTSAASYKIVTDTDSDENAETDVTGSTGKIYSIDISNGGGTHTSYTKFKLSSGVVTPGTTEPDLLLLAKPNTAKQYVFPAGLDFDQLSFWTTRNGETSDTTAPNTTIVTILCS